MEQEQSNDRYHAGYFQHKARIPEISINSITQAGSPPFIYRHHSGNKTDIKKNKNQGLLVKEVLVHNCTDIKQGISHSKQDIFTVRESIISS